MAIKNEYNTRRTAKAQFTVPNAATTTSSGVIVPKGAIVTGVVVNAPDAVTVTNAAATAQIVVGGVDIVATQNVSDFANDVPVTLALATTNGVALTADSEIKLETQASSTSAVTASWDVFVDYIYADS